MYQGREAKFYITNVKFSCSFATEANKSRETRKKNNLRCKKYVRHYLWNALFSYTLNLRQNVKKII